MNVAEYTKAIPSMGGREIGLFLASYAAQARAGEAIVELGVWLGAGTAQMALACAGRDVEIHGYDRFEARASEIRKAAAGGIVLKSHQNTLPMVSTFLGPIGAKVRLHRGNIANAKAPNRKIALYVDDACKRPKAFFRALRTFSPLWIPGRTIVVLMDYLFFMHNPDPDLKCQHEFVKHRPDSFEELWRRPEISCAAFLYRRPFVVDPAYVALYDRKRG